jgi:hypothetical protein
MRQKLGKKKKLEREDWREKRWVRCGRRMRDEKKWV